MREGLKTLVAMDAARELVGEASDGQQAIEQAILLRPDVALIDLRMPGLSGIEGLGAIGARVPEVRGIVLTTFSGDEDVYQAFRAGAKAYLLKDASRAELNPCIRSVSEHGLCASPVAQKALAAHLDVAELTRREREVLTLVVAGRANKEIAGALPIAEGTIKAHVNRVLRKLGVLDAHRGRRHRRAAGHRAPGRFSVSPNDGRPLARNVEGHGTSNRSVSPNSARLVAGRC